MPDAFFFSVPNRNLIGARAARYGMPTIYFEHIFVEVRPTVVLEGDLLFGRGKLKKVDAAFLEAYCQHFQEVGHGIFQKMYDQYPTKYFEGLISLAKAGMPLHVRHELGRVGDFDDSPSKVDEALDKAEETGGRQARAMLKRMLDELAEAERKYLEHKED
jgi:hypothetical protein